jgi:uncharacterized glyoxalase superfamily protein PhnB
VRPAEDAAAADVNDIQPELWVARAGEAVRVVDPFGREWEIGKPLGARPPG